MAKVTFTDPKFEWDIANSAPVQSRMQAVAARGVVIGKALAAPHFKTGEMTLGISMSGDHTGRGMYPVKDYVINFEHEAIRAIEYGHKLSGMYAPRGGSEKRVEGLFIAHKTLKALGG